MKCLSCGFENPATSKFCSKCGNILQPVEGHLPTSTRQPPQTGGIKTSLMAIVSLVLGICSFTGLWCLTGIPTLFLGVCFFAGLWCLTGIPAIITGHIARRKIRQSGGSLTGNGLALAGLIIGYTGTVMSVFVVLMLASIAVPNYIREKEKASIAIVNSIRAKEKTSSAVDDSIMAKEKATSDVPDYTRAKEKAPSFMRHYIKTKEDAMACMCANNLRMIQIAKEQFAIEHGVSDSYVPMANELRAYFKNGQIPAEPTGSSYNINAIDKKPTCNSGRPGHQF